MTWLAGMAGCFAVVLAAVTVRLWLTEPLALAEAIGQGQAPSVAAVLLRLLAAALGSLVGAA